MEELKEIQTEHSIDKKERKTNNITKTEKNIIIKINIIKDASHNHKKKMINHINPNKKKLKYNMKNLEKSLLVITEKRNSRDLLKT